MSEARDNKLPVRFSIILHLLRVHIFNALPSPFPSLSLFLRDWVGCWWLLRHLAAKNETHNRDALT